MAADLRETPENQGVSENRIDKWEFVGVNEIYVSILTISARA